MDKTTTKKETKVLDSILADLARSGLTESDAKRMKITHVKAKGTENDAYKIPYFKIDGKADAFYRLRYLPTEKKVMGKKVVVEPTLRYTQLPDTVPHLYFCPLLKGRSWKDVAKDPELEVWFTEGEKKAASACKLGVPTIGLGGVWSFRSSKSGKLLLPDFDLIEWAKRDVTVIFDSDFTSNEHVRAAMVMFAKELSRLGALVRLAFVPPGPDDEKRGLDDYFMEHSLDDFYADVETDQYDESFALWEMSDKIAFIRDVGCVYEFSTGKLWDRNKLVASVMANCEHEVGTPDGKVTRVNTASAWLKWPRRLEYAKLVYEPGESKVLGSDLNTWPGWGCEAKKGDVKPFYKLINYLFQRDAKNIPWFMQWLAYPIQNPGVKLYTSVLVHGRTHGTGKSFIGVIMSRLYGRNYSEIGSEDLESQFNEWAVSKQFIMGEEITGGDKRRDADKIKRIITRELLSVNSKYQPVYTIRDCVNYYLTSQHPDALFIEPTDRRFFIVEAPDEALSRDTYREIDEWKDSEAGPSALLHHLLHDVDCSEFDPKDPAPHTDAKADMLHLSLSDLDQFCEALKVDPDSVCRVGGVVAHRDLFTPAELLHLYDPEGSKRTTLHALGKALRRAGFRRLPLTTTATGSKNLYAVRNHEKWASAQHSARAAEYDKKSAVGLPGSEKPRKYAS